MGSRIKIDSTINAGSFYAIIPNKDSKVSLTSVKQRILIPPKILDITWIKSGDSNDDYTLSELLDLIKQKSAAIVMAVGNLEMLIGEVDE